MAGRRIERRRAIVLDRTKLGEQDLILTMLSVGGEQLRVVAKGARKPGSRLAARTELFCDVDFTVSFGRGLGIVSEAEVIDAHDGLSYDIEALSCASAMCEVARLTCYEDMEDAYLHPLLSRALRACLQSVGDRARLDVSYAAYVLKALSHGGWRPVLTECVACGEPGGTRLSVSAGGVICESCAQSVEGAEPITQPQLGWIKALIGLTFDDLLRADVNTSTSAYLAGVAHQWGTTHLDCRLRASEFFIGT